LNETAFDIAFGYVFGAGIGVLAVLFLAALMGFVDD
jgi:hypothetical protein